MEGAEGIHRNNNALIEGAVLVRVAADGTPGQLALFLKREMALVAPSRQEAVPTLPPLLTMCVAARRF